MLGHAGSFRLASQEIIPAFISYTSSERQSVRAERANPILLQPCEMIEGREVA